MYLKIKIANCPKKPCQKLLRSQFLRITKIPELKKPIINLQEMTKQKNMFVELNHLKNVLH